MKKILITMIIVQNLLLTLIGLKIYDNYMYNKIIYADKSAVLLRNETLNNDDFFEELQKFDSEISITKYMFKENNEVIIYTNDMTLNRNIDTKINKLDSGMFIANYSSGNKKQIDQFYIYPSSLKITIYPIKEVINNGVDGLYYFSHSVHMEDIIQKLNSSGIYAEYYTDFEVSMSELIDEYFELFVSSILLILIVISITIYFTISKMKKISILKINGFSNKQVIYSLMLELQKSLFIVLCMEGLSIFGICLIYQKVDDLSTFLKIYFLMFAFVYLLVGVIVSASIISISKFENNISMMKGKKPYRIVSLVNWGLRLSFLCALLFGIVDLKENVSVLNDQNETINIWENTKNIYAIALKYVGDSRDSQRRLANFYMDLDNEGALLIDAQNYELVEDNMHVYDYNSPGERSLYEANGKSITVNENYLRKNPVMINGNKESVFEQLIFDENVENVLVPTQLKKYEKQLYKSYLEDFYFQKVEVQNIYENGINTSSIDELMLNIIYIDDGYACFPYNDNIGEQEKSGLIVDPVIKIYTKNIDISYAQSFLSRCVFFSYDGNDAYSHILPSIQKNGVSSEIQSVDSIYAIKGEAMARLALRRRYLSLVVVIIMGIFFTTSYLLTSSYFEKNQYQFYIKKINGFTLKQRIGYFLIKVIGVNLIVVLIVSKFLNQYLVIPIGLMILAIDILLVLVISNINDTKNFNKIIKGEH